MVVELNAKVVELLKKLEEQAADRKMPLETYLSLMVEPGSARAQAKVPLSDEEFEALLDEMAEGSDGLPPLADISRADIYSEQDR